MEFHQVRYFLALAGTLNFTSAADRCNVTQPALSKAIQKLEQELGGDLIHRERGSTQLTDLGKLVLPLLERMTAAAEAARVQARDFKETAIALLRIGLAPTVSASIVVGALSEVARNIPGLEIELVPSTAAKISAALLDGELHAGIVGSPVNLGGRIDRIPLFRERLVVLSPATHAFAQTATIPPTMLEDAFWLELVESDVGEQFRRNCFRPGCEPTIVHRGHQENHLQHMAAAGLGVMLAPEHAPRVRGLVARPIEGDPVQRTVELLVMAGRRYSPALYAFIKIARLRDWRRQNGPETSFAAAPSQVDGGGERIARRA